MDWKWPEPDASCLDEAPESCAKTSDDAVHIFFSLEQYPLAVHNQMLFLTAMLDKYGLSLYLSILLWIRWLGAERTLCSNMSSHTYQSRNTWHLRNMDMDRGWSNHELSDVSSSHRVYHIMDANGATGLNNLPTLSQTTSLAPSSMPPFSSSEPIDGESRR